MGYDSRPVWYNPYTGGCDNTSGDESSHCILTWKHQLQPGSPMKPALVAFAAVLHFLLLSLSQLSAAEPVTLEGGGLSSRWEQSTGRLTGLECKTPGYEG